MNYSLLLSVKHIHISIFPLLVNTDHYPTFILTVGNFGLLILFYLCWLYDNHHFNRIKNHGSLFISMDTYVNYCSFNNHNCPYNSKTLKVMIVFDRYSFILKSLVNYNQYHNLQSSFIVIKLLLSDHSISFNHISTSHSKHYINFIYISYTLW